MIRAIIITLFLSLGLQLSAQQVTIIEDSGISAMIQAHKDLNRSNQTVDGWRVQLLASTDRNKVMEVKGEFLKKYPRIKIDWDYSAPYYKLKAGAFLTKLEAANLKHRIRYDYPDAYIARDNVKLKDL